MVGLIAELGYLHWDGEVYIMFIIIGVTLVNKIIQVSGAQFYNTASVYCKVYVIFLFILDPLPERPQL